MATDYKQYNYSAYYAGEPFSCSACGPTSCADVLDISPLTTAQWMTNHGYAYNGQGTAWEGIPACISAYGGSGKQLNTGSLLGQTSSSVFTKWQQHIQQGYIGVLLMGRGTNNYWTNGGHYIAVVQYSNNQYLIYDPASASRTGWHPFSDLAGNIKVCYTTEIKWGSAPSSTYTFSPATVNQGSRNKSVLLLQEILCARGYYDRKLGLDGAFGDGTRKAVIEYQKDRNLSPDGSCGPLTWGDLLGMTMPTITVKTLSYGSKGVEVLLLQEILAAKQLYGGALDQDFGPATQAALKAYQTANGLAIDGYCGPITWKNLLQM